MTGALTVSAASSLTQTFTQLATNFEHLHPGTSVAFNFGSSGALATQIVSGAPADVFASASPSDMTTVQQAHLVHGTPVTFARNRLEIVVKPGNPLGIHSLADLTKASVVSICVPTAPCGSTAQEALTKAGVTLATSKVSLGANVDATLAQVTTGDADAAIVYVTNAVSVGTDGWRFPSRRRRTSPPAIRSPSSPRPRTVRWRPAWVAYVLGPVGPDDASPGALPAARLTGVDIWGQGAPPPARAARLRGGRGGTVGAPPGRTPHPGLVVDTRNRPDVVGGPGRPPPLPRLFTLGDRALPRTGPTPGVAAGTRTEFRGKSVVRAITVLPLCSPRWSAEWRSCWRSAGTESSGARCSTGSVSSSRSARRVSCSPRPSWPCPS